MKTNSIEAKSGIEKSTQITFTQRLNKRNPINKSWFFWTALIGLSILTIIEYIDAHTGFLRGYKIEGEELINEDVRIAFAWTATTTSAIGLFKLIRQDKDWLIWFGYGVVALGINGVWLGKPAQMVKRLLQITILFYTAYTWRKQAKKLLPPNMPLPAKGVVPISSASTKELIQALAVVSISISIFGFILPTYETGLGMFNGSTKLLGKYQTEIILDQSALEQIQQITFSNDIIAEITSATERAQAPGKVIKDAAGNVIGRWEATKLGETLSKTQEYFDSIAIFGAAWGAWSKVNKRWQSSGYKFIGDFMTLIGYLIIGAWVSVFSQLIFNSVQFFGVSDWKNESDKNKEKGYTTAVSYAKHLTEEFELSIL